MKALAAILFALTLNAAEAPWLTLNRASGDAIRAHDYKKLRELLLELKPLMPGNPRVIYNLAASDAVLGNRDAALTGLHNLAQMGLIYDLAADEDFASLRNLPQYTAALARMAENKQPVSTSTLAFALPGSDILPEDIAYDAKTRRFLISSVRRSQVLTAAGKEFARAPWSVLALAIDPKNRILWATAGWVPHCANCAAADKDKTALLAFHLDTGALRNRIDSPLPGLLGDMTISHNGDIYVSEGIHGAVLHLAPNAKTFERLDDEGEFPSPQTPALSLDEKTLYIPDYVRGIAAMDLATHKVRWLVPSGRIALNGIDGLYVHSDSFIAIQNGTNPARLIRFSLDLQQQQIIEAGTPGLGEPTHGTFLGNTFYFLANSGWGGYDGQGKKKPGSEPTASAVWKVDVGNDKWTTPRK